MMGVCPGGYLSRGYISLGYLSWGVYQGGICPQAFCLGFFCLGVYVLESMKPPNKESMPISNMNKDISSNGKDKDTYK